MSSVFLIGHPNSGKTTLFNLLTGSKFKTVNYPGSTTTYVKGRLSCFRDTFVIDSPGIIALNPQTLDEEETIKALLFEKPNLVLVVVNGLQMRRQLSLFKQCKDSGLSALLVITMQDYLQTPIDEEKLSGLLEAPVMALDAKRDCQKGYILQSLCHEKLKPSFNFKPMSQPEKDHQWAESMAKQIQIKRKPLMEWDKLFLHPILGFILFFCIMFSFFWLIYVIAAPLMDSIAWASNAGILVIKQVMPANLLTHYLVDGVLLGFSSVFMFVPQIFILFFLIGLLEGTGYLARAAVLIDKPLSWFGLNGRSFFPFLSGYACAIPALMATRSISGKRERILSLALIPLLSCSARLPIYGLLIGFLIPDLFWKSMAMVGVYVLGLLIVAIVAKVLGLFFPKSYSGFQIELPEWQMPLIKPLLFQAWVSTLSFIKNAGPIIMLVGSLFWAFMNFPSPDHPFAMEIGKYLSPVLRPLGVDYRVGFAIIASFAAREVFVSALTVAFGANKISFSAPTICALIMFFMVSMQCLSTLVVFKKEYGSWTFPIALSISYIVLGYVLAVGTYQLVALL